MIQHLELSEFLKRPGVILDVRSPGEFIQGRIPSAINLPLFSDSERACIGTLYKQEGHERAVFEGLKIVGGKLCDFVVQAKAHLNHSPAKVHCWRGGLRSSSMAWLLETAGIPTVTLKGGYKTFRRWALKVVESPCSLRVIGGYTGSGKSAILRCLKDLGEQVLDLEQLANHRGSSFGMLGMPEQPSTEQFENEIALIWQSFDPGRPIWIEDESRQIGTCTIPLPLFNRMRSSSLIVIDRPSQERLDRLVHEYGRYHPADLISAANRLVKRLGSVRTKEITAAIERGNLGMAFEMLLKYYDSTYDYGIMKQKRSFYSLKNENISDLQWAHGLLDLETTKK